MHLCIVSPSGSIDPQYIERAVIVLRRWGHSVRVAPHATGKEGRFAGSDTERIEDLCAALENSSIEAILCARGGYGLQRIIDQLPPITKPIIGFSDITALHMLCAQQGQPSIHGLMCKHIAEADTDDATPLYLAYQRALHYEPLTYHIESNSLNRVGKARGTLIGGNLSVLYGLQGTPYGLDTLLTTHPAKPYILFIEDIAERHYHIDRMMQNLRLSGVLPRLQGLIIGTFSDCEDDPSMGCTIQETIRHAVEAYDYPILFNFPAGHTQENYPLYLNAPVEIQVDTYSSTIVSAFKSS